jgi:hypothetical protein
MKFLEVVQMCIHAPCAPVHDGGVMCRQDSWAESCTKLVHDGWIEQIEMVQDLGGLVSCGADSSIIVFEYPFKVL